MEFLQLNFNSDLFKVELRIKLKYIMGKCLNPSIYVSENSPRKKMEMIHFIIMLSRRF